MTGCQRRSVSLSSSETPLCHGNICNSQLPRSGLLVRDGLRFTRHSGAKRPLAAVHFTV